MGKEDLEDFQRGKAGHVQRMGTRMALGFLRATVEAGEHWSEALQLVRNSAPGLTSHNLEHFKTCKIALFFSSCGPFLRSQAVMRAYVSSR